MCKRSGGARTGARRGPGAWARRIGDRRGPGTRARRMKIDEDVVGGVVVAGAVAVAIADADGRLGGGSRCSFGGSVGCETRLLR